MSWISHEWVTAVGTLVGGLATAGALVYAGWQIALTRRDQKRNEDWRRTEFARSLIDRLSSDDELAFCARALEWGVGPLIIPEKYRILFDSSEGTFEHNQDSMREALGVGLNGGWSAPTALTYRYSFDTFFSYVELISFQTDAGNLNRDQLVGFDYYLKLIREPPYLGWENESHPFKPFVKRYYPELIEFIWPKLKSECSKEE